VSDIDKARAGGTDDGEVETARGSRAASGSRQARGVATRLELVLAAERLFALHGLMGVSLREIVAATSQRNLATVHYHFGSREGLAHAICDLRMPAIEQDRAQRLTRYLEALPPPERRTAALLRIQIESSLYPVIESEGRSHFRRLLAHSYLGNVIDLRAYIVSRYDLGIRQTAELLRQEQPHLSRETFGIRWSLFIRSMSYLLANLEARLEREPWQIGGPLLQREATEMAGAFAGLFAVPDDSAAAPARLSRAGAAPGRAARSSDRSGSSGR
jgi:AcrR family transcriptional regulator